MPSPPVSVDPPRRILIVVPRRIGDVLLSTPLARSLKQAWPDASIDYLVFRGTEGVLVGNPDIAQAHTMPERGGLLARLKPMFRLARRYDLAVSPIPSDRARLACWIAGRLRAGVVREGTADSRQRRLLHVALPFDDVDTHTVSAALRLIAALDVSPVPQVVPPQPAALPAGVQLPRTPFVVLHAYPKFRYKMWPQAAWVALIDELARRGLPVVLTGSPDPAERSYVAQLAAAAASPALDLSGQLSFAQTVTLLQQAAAYVGPDTAVTHLAAACGVPTVALFGPSNPVKWGPWPIGYPGPDSPWAMRGSSHVGNVFLLQGQLDCVPCRLEGCERHVDSDSRCLTELPMRRVTEALVALGVLVE